MTAALSPPLRIERRTDAQRRHLPRVERTEALLTAFATGAGDPRVPRARLRALSGRLRASPFWRARAAARGISLAAVESLDDLAAFPPLARAELAGRGAELVTEDAGDDLVRVRSSGTTGAPLDVYRSGYECVHMWAVLRAFARIHRVRLPPRPRAVLLCTLPAGLAYSVRAPLFHRGALHRISTSRPRPAERLARVRPALICTDPAGLHWLSAHGAPGPALVASSAQHLAPALRELAARRLAAPVVDYYATTETGPIAWRCPRGRLHVLAPDVHVEALGGELAVTVLRPGPWPLVRYLPGDRGEVVDGRCGCGFSGRSIEGFGGREAARFVRPDGEAVDAWALAPVFKHHPLRAFRLTQRGAARFALEVEGAGAEAREALGRAARSGLRALGWRAPALEVIGVARLDGGAKPRPFVGMARAADPGGAAGGGRTVGLPQSPSARARNEAICARVTGASGQ